jgi:hypothetical protein
MPKIKSEFDYDANWFFFPNTYPFNLNLSNERKFVEVPEDLWDSYLEASRVYQEKEQELLTYIKEHSNEKEQ